MRRDLYEQMEAVWREFEESEVSGEVCDHLRQLAYVWRMLVDRELEIAELRSRASRLSKIRTMDGVQN